MPNTSSAALPYPALSDAPNGPGAIQALAAALDQKVIVRQLNAAARNAMTKYDGLLVHETSTDRRFRWESSGSRWEYDAGPWYTWTPTLTTPAGVPVTHTGPSRGEYVVRDGLLDFKAEIRFMDPIDGRTGQLVFPLPTGHVARAGFPSQQVACVLYAPTTGYRWMGCAQIIGNGSYLEPLFPVNLDTVGMTALVNATSSGATGTGTPLIPGAYPLTNTSEFNIWGRIKLSAWPAL